MTTATASAFHGVTPTTFAAGTSVPPQEVAHQRLTGRPVRLIDVRTPAEFAALHAIGAESVPLDRLDPAAILAASPPPTPADPLYVICKSGGRAARACAQLVAAGCATGAVINVEGGTDAWAAAGLPVVRGSSAPPLSLERQVRIAAGLLVLTGVLLGWLVHPAFFGLCAFVGAGLTFAGLTDWCGMGLLLARMPWNRRECGS